MDDVPLVGRRSIAARPEQIYKRVTAVSAQDRSRSLCGKAFYFCAI